MCQWEATWSNATVALECYLLGQKVQTERKIKRKRFLQRPLKCFDDWVRLESHRNTKSTDDKIWIIHLMLLIRLCWLYSCQVLFEEEASGERRCWRGHLQPSFWAATVGWMDWQHVQVVCLCHCHCLCLCLPILPWLTFPTLFMTSSMPSRLSGVTICAGCHCLCHCHCNCDCHNLCRCLCLLVSPSYWRFRKTVKTYKMCRAESRDGLSGNEVRGALAANQNLSTRRKSCFSWTDRRRTSRQLDFLWNYHILWFLPPFWQLDFCGII